MNRAAGSEKGDSHSFSREASPTASRGRSSLQRPDEHRHRGRRLLPRDEHRHQGRRLLPRDEHRHQGRRLLPRDGHPRPAHRPQGPLERLASRPCPEQPRLLREPPRHLERPLRPEPPPGREHRRRHLAPHRLQARPLPRRGEHPHPVLPHPHRGSRQPPAHLLPLPHHRAADGLRHWRRRSQRQGPWRRRDSLT
jgi:hypothetical protein